MGQEKGDGIMSQPDPTFQVFGLESHWLFEETKRLDASFYATDVIASRILIGDIQKHGFGIGRVQDLADDVFWPGRFKRKYVSKDVGEPFLMPSEAIMFLPKAKKFVVNYPRDVAVKRDWLLITRSGTVGRCLLATKLLENHVLSDDLIRIIPKDDTNVGYLYAYLNTHIGQAFLAKDQYGATVKHIEPHHVAGIPVPRIPKFEYRVNQMVLKAHRLREGAQELLLEANELLYSKLGLPKIDEDNVGYFGGEQGRIIRSFGIRSSQLNLRLDASYHLPILKLIESNLMGIKENIHLLGTKLESISIPPRFKRPYVRYPELGVRYIRPSDLPLAKYFESRYLAKTFRDCNLYRLREGDILVVTDGTIGWVSIVTSEIAQWYGSNNFARLVPASDLDRGYLLAYLSSPYGQYQLKREIFGGVIDHLTEDQICQVKIPLPAIPVQQEIGEIMTRAYTYRDQANKLEDEAIKLLEDKLRELAQSNDKHG
jgi:type I restriction enzyme S subunit